MAHHPYIAIEGVIGVGKTTLARLLQPYLKGTVLLEEFEENPFLSDFYGDRQRYAFQTQIFFLLSRYRQQSSTIPPALRHGAVIADYTFVKDSLFADLNLRGDELAVYRRVFEALDEKIPTPDLIVYLRADLDVLLGRIAARDRPFERNMDPDYIEHIRLAYEQFVNVYDEAPILTIDTNDLNIVHNPKDLESVAQRIKSSLEYGTYQAQLPGVGSLPARKPQAILEDLEDGRYRLADFQQFHLSLDAEKGFDPDPYLNFISLTEEIGELAQVLRRMWLHHARLQGEGRAVAEASDAALAAHREQVADELADCLAYLLKLSNYAGIELEQAYLDKMALNAKRTWRDGQIVQEGE
jgi:deoxyguanosine kinase